MTTDTDLAPDNRDGALTRWFENTIAMRLRMEKRWGARKTAFALIFGYAGVVLMGVAPVLFIERHYLMPWQLFALVGAIGVFWFIGQSRRRAITEAQAVPGLETGDARELAEAETIKHINARHDFRHMVMALVFGLLGFGFLTFLQLSQEKALAEVREQQYQADQPPPDAVFIDNSPEARPQTPPQ
jgi:hypothetical protein